MLLIAVKEDKGCLLTRWNLTYAVGWEHICKSANSMFVYYDHPEILVDDKLMKISSREDIFKLDEAVNMTIRGVFEDSEGAVEDNIF